MAETLPPAHRGRMGMLVGAAGSLAASVTPLLTRAGNQWPMFGLEGWRLTLLAAGCGGLVVFAMALRLPESPRWLQRRTAGAGSTEPVQPAAGTSEGSFGGRLALLLALQMLLPLDLFGFTALSGVVMRQKGVDLHGSLLFLAVAGVGALGSLTASFFVDRFARQRLYATGCLVLGGLGLALALSTSVGVAMGIAACFFFSVTIVATTLNVYGPEMFGTARRGLATGLGYAAYRAGAAFVPLAMLPLLLSRGALPTFSVIAAGMAASAVLVVLFGPRGTAGRALH